ncbi:MAG: hypothetical protein P857_645 [Candidatus Xenolissoclinum pacificiensis L6]|uniref:Uncharacterized protein n=1 Tax=Candidatus Xenolissoclinum pacificiensis L6 TaxID=1401685 RepID=W2V0H2_9RICK|nr:MAG: hypothetical protein P857_645 [Candidatus Xenolissoclinum pacificiensis L6]
MITTEINHPSNGGMVLSCNYRYCLLVKISLNDDLNIDNKLDNVHKVLESVVC